jgi:hypothetical protein
MKKILFILLVLTLVGCGDPQEVRVEKVYVPTPVLQTDSKKLEAAYQVARDALLRIDAKWNNSYGHFEAERALKDMKSILSENAQPIEESE